MENASKALLIAGAVLIAILLISMGIKIFTSTTGKDAEVNATMDTVAVSSFNSRFLDYVSNNVSASEVRKFIQLVMANDSTVETKGGHKVYLNYYDTTGSNMTDNAHKKVHINGQGTYDGELGINSLSELLYWIQDGRTYRIFVTTSCNTGETNGGYINGYVACMSIALKD